MMDTSQPIDPATLDYRALLTRFNRPVIVTNDEAAALMCVSVATVSRMIRDGRIPPQCLEPWGDVVRIMRGPFLAWLDTQERRAA